MHLAFPSSGFFISRIEMVASGKSYVPNTDKDFSIDRNSRSIGGVDEHEVTESRERKESGYY